MGLPPTRCLIGYFLGMDPQKAVPLHSSIDQLLTRCRFIHLEFAIQVVTPNLKLTSDERVHLLALYREFEVLVPTRNEASTTTNPVPTACLWLTSHGHC
jgi:hypothetical protein